MLNCNWRNNLTASGMLGGEGDFDLFFETSLDNVLIAGTGGSRERDTDRLRASLWAECKEAGEVFPFTDRVDTGVALPLGGAYTDAGVVRPLAGMCDAGVVRPLSGMGVLRPLIGTNMFRGVVLPLLG